VSGSCEVVSLAFAKQLSRKVTKCGGINPNDRMTIYVEKCNSSVGSFKRLVQGANVGLFCLVVGLTTSRLSK
jgi:hypothetical protein